MIARRYREGRLVRSRRLRRATLENARNLALLKVDAMLETLDRFTLMLAVLRALAEPATESPETGNES